MFLTQWQFWDKCIKWPQSELDHPKVKGTPWSTYVLLVFQSPKFHSVSLYDQLFWLTGHLLSLNIVSPTWQIGCPTHQYRSPKVQTLEWDGVFVCSPSSACGLNFLWNYSPGFFQLLPVASSCQYAQQIKLSFNPLSLWKTWHRWQIFIKHLGAILKGICEGRCHLRRQLQGGDLDFFLPGRNFA